MNTEYLYKNIIPLIFYLGFNSSTTYLFLTNKFNENALMILYSIGIYEFINIFLELCSKKVNKEFLAHHIGAVGTCVLTVYNYESLQKHVINDLIYCQTLLISSSLYLLLQYIFPYSVLLKAIFVFTYFYYRIILVYPFILKILSGKHYPTDLVTLTLQASCIMFYILSCYWMIRIFKYMCKFFFLNKIK